MRSFEYQILRYRPFAFPGEWVAVGVLAYDAKSGAIRFEVSQTVERARGLFANLDLTWLKPELNLTKTQFRTLAGGYEVVRDGVFPATELIGREIAQVSSRILPPNDASLSFGKAYRAAAGEDIDGFFADLVARVLEAHRKPKRERLSDAEVWRKRFSPNVPLKALEGFEPHYSVRTAFKPLAFEFGFQNGALHLLEPTSFDIERESVERKIERRFGRYSMLAKSTSDMEFRVYIPMVPPQECDLQQEIVRAFDSDNFGARVRVDLYEPKDAKRLSKELAAIERA